MFDQFKSRTLRCVWVCFRTSSAMVSLLCWVFYCMTKKGTLFPFCFNHYNWPLAWLPVSKKLHIFPSQLLTLAQHATYFGTMGVRVVEKVVVMGGSLSTSVAMVAKIPIASFSLEVIGNQWIACWDICCILKNGWSLLVAMQIVYISQICLMYMGDYHARNSVILEWATGALKLIGRSHCSEKWRTVEEWIHVEYLRKFFTIINKL